ncbi:hypothetical protein, partial [Pseudomonas sp. BJa3]|uniref:hypothetical protein n=1 Tax=Pseudomonas sp. BJa3 TaxID=2986525 RepID=UPI002265993D
MTNASVRPWLNAAALLCFSIVLATFVLFGQARAAEPGAVARTEAKRVLILYSFGREFRPW